MGALHFYLNWVSSKVNMYSKSLNPPNSQLNSTQPNQSFSLTGIRKFQTFVFIGRDRAS